MALCREANEELGITIKPEDVAFAHLQHHLSNKEYVYVYFTAKKWHGTPQVLEPDKCDDVQWFPLNKLPENLVYNTAFVIDCYLKGERYSETGFSPAS